VLCGAFLAALVLAGAGLSAANAPRVRIASSAPLALRGERFYAREKVRLVVAVGTDTVRRTVVTTAAGSFTAVFAKLRLDRCSKRLKVAAVGARGDRTGFTLETLECPDGGTTGAPTGSSAG